MWRIIKKYQIIKIYKIYKGAKSGKLNTINWKKTLVPNTILKYEVLYTKVLLFKKYFLK